MFSDESLDPVEFKSSWKRERPTSEFGVQTGDLDTKDRACQSVKRRHKEVQTEEEERLGYQLAEDEVGRLREFLLEVEPFMSHQLQRNCRSHAFDGYHATSIDEEDTITCLHTLTNSVLDETLQVTGLSWNSTGAVIATAYGRHDHEDWCTHKSTLCTWNIDRQNVKANKPDLSIDVSSCLMCISFHPSQPSWIVGGTFNGEVIVWDTSREDEMVIATSGIGDDSHREPVSKVLWVKDPDSKGKKYLVISISSDGKMLIWKPDIHHQTLQLIDGFILLTESLPRALRVKARRGDQEMGVTCIAFNQDDISTFLVGSESGGIFKCSADARGTPANSAVISSVPLRSPVTFNYDPHHGPVHSVEWSPYHRNLFLSSAMDGNVRIYSLLQAMPILSIEPGTGYLYSAKWSPVRPLVFGVASETGKLLLYDLKVKRAAPAQVIECSEKKNPLFSLQFNYKQKQLVATGDELGYVQVWKLGGDLTEQGTKETEILDELASSVLE